MDEQNYSSEIIIFDGQDESQESQSRPGIQELKDKGREAVIINGLTDMLHRYRFFFCNLTVPQHRVLAFTEFLLAHSTAQLADPIQAILLSDV